MCLGNISKDFTNDNLKQTGFVKKMFVGLLIRVNVD